MELFQFSLYIALILLLKCDVIKFRIPPPLSHNVTLRRPPSPLNVWLNLWMAPYWNNIILSLWWDKNISLDTQKITVVESVACYGCEVWLLKAEEQKKLLALEVTYEGPDYKISQTPQLAAKCKQNNQVLTEFKEGIWNGMDTSLEWKIIVDRRRFINGHRTVEGEEEDRNYHGISKWRTSWEAETYKLWQKIDSCYMYRS